jgi:hypothetical protein
MDNELNPCCHNCKHDVYDGFCQYYGTHGCEYKHYEPKSNSAPTFDRNLRSETMDNELIPCAHCGSSDLYEIEEIDGLNIPQPAIFCNTCKTTFTIEDDSQTLDDAERMAYLKPKLKAAWNRRAEPENKPLTWIPVSERLPEKNDTFIICTSYGDVFVAEFWINRKDFTRKDGSNFIYPVMYWQPLPQPPKEKNR